MYYEVCVVRNIAHMIYRSCLFIFALTDIDSTEPVQEGPVPVTVPVGSGYSQSKWIAESLLDIAAQRTSLRSMCVRVGQISGSSSGAWSHAEWLPSLIKSSVTLGALPSVSEVSHSQDSMKCTLYLNYFLRLRTYR